MIPIDEVDALLFDMDGTLIDLGERWWKPFIRAFDRVKPDFDKQKRQEVLDDMITQVMETSQGSSKLLKLQMVWKSARALKLSLFDVVKVLRNVKSDPMAFKNIVPLEGVNDILEVLHSRGYDLAIVTNAGDKTVNRVKKHIEFLNNFDVIITRNKVKKIKPYPESLLLACMELGKDPSMCAMIGDFPQDIRAGKAAGTKTVGILGDLGNFTRSSLELEKPDFIISSLVDLMNLFPGTKTR